ncbi:beta-galactosidase [Streptomyces alboflavus]
MVPHAGEDSAVFRGVTELGATLAELAPVAGSVREPAAVAVLFDWESWWAGEQDSHPTSRLDYRQEALDWYSALLALGIRADVITTDADLAPYRLLVAPVLHVVPGDLADRLARYAEGGGHLVTTYFSGVVDENDHVWLGGYPGALRELLGVRVEEFGPLLDGDAVAVDGDALSLDGDLTGTLWADRVDVVDPAVEVLAEYRSGEHAGRPVVTRRRAGSGTAAYVGTRLGAEGLAGLLPRLLDAAEVRSELPAAARGRVELTVRRTEDHRYLFLVNRTDEAVTVTGLVGDVLIGAHEDVLTGTREDVPQSHLTLPPRGVAVLREPAP